MPHKKQILLGIYSIGIEAVTPSCWCVAVGTQDSNVVLGNPRNKGVCSTYYVYRRLDTQSIVLQETQSGRYLVDSAGGLAATGAGVDAAVELDVQVGGAARTAQHNWVAFFCRSGELSRVVAAMLFQNGQALKFYDDFSVLICAFFSWFAAVSVSQIQASKKGCSLAFADLSGLDLRGVDFSGCDLSQTVLVDTDLRGAKLNGANFTGCDLTVARLDAAPDLGQTAGTAATFQNATVPCSLLGRNWSNLDLSQATLVGAPEDLSTKAAPLVASRANLSRIRGLPATLHFACFDDATLNDVNLASTDLEGATFKRAYLKGARFSGANLKCTDLTGAWLIARENGAEPEPADFSGAFMANSVLDAVHADGVGFEGAQLYYYGGFPGNSASARGAFLNLAKFGKANLYKFDLSQAALRGADFIQANLVNATLHHADLTTLEGSPKTAASMSLADLRGADCSGANMQGAILTGAQCSSQTGHYQAQFADWKGAPIKIDDALSATRLGDTDQETVCPNGSAGPCRPPS